jgi:hypothetical protein
LQVAAFTQQRVSEFMWGWRMPMGGAHEPFWSRKFYLTGRH